MKWNIKPGGLKGILEKSLYKGDKDTWIRNNIHDDNQNLMVTFSNGLKVKARVVDNGKVKDFQDVENEVRRRLRHRMSDYYSNELRTAYDQWFELYQVPEQADAIAPVFADVEVQPSQGQSSRNWFSNMLTRKAHSPRGVLVDERGPTESLTGGKTRKRKTKRNRKTKQNRKRKNKKI
jgi:hypothetical protein